MHSKSDIIEIMINDETDEVIKELVKPLQNRYQNKNQWKSNKLVFKLVPLLYYKCHEINPNSSASYIDSPDSIKNKKAAIDPINKRK